MSTDTLIEKYIALRDRKGVLKGEYDASVAKIDEALDKLEAHFRKELDAQGLEKMGSKTGVVFKSTVNSATVADKDVFREFLLKTGEWALADLRASKTAVKEFIAANDDLPPGVNWRTESVIRVNRP